MWIIDLFRNKPTATLLEIHTELVHQRTNCLTTLQSQGKLQIDLLGKVVDTLSDIRTSTVELNEHLKEKL